MGCFLLKGLAAEAGRKLFQGVLVVFAEWVAIMTIKKRVYLVVSNQQASRTMAIVRGSQESVGGGVV